MNRLYALPIHKKLLWREQSQQYDNGMQNSQNIIFALKFLCRKRKEKIYFDKWQKLSDQVCLDLRKDAISRDLINNLNLIKTCLTSVELITSHDTNEIKIISHEKLLSQKSRPVFCR